MFEHIDYRLGTFFAALVVLAATAPASASTRITLGSLVPVAPAPANAAANAGSCDMPDSIARVTQAYSAQALKQVVTQTDHATAEVMVDLDSVGNLVQARIYHTSGNPILDDQALTAARGSKYAPEVHNCSSFKRSYYLDISFDTPSAS